MSSSSVNANLTVTLTIDTDISGVNGFGITLTRPLKVIDAVFICSGTPTAGRTLALRKQATAIAGGGFTNIVAATGFAVAAVANAVSRPTKDFVVSASTVLVDESINLKSDNAEVLGTAYITVIPQSISNA